MIIDHTYKYIYTAIPKTGSISIQFSLGHNDIPEPDLYHQSLLTTLDNNKEFCNYFKFAFVRNPWDRLLSLYHDFTINRVCQYSALVVHEKPLLSEFEDFNDMCIRLHDSHWIDDIFFQSQYNLLSDGNKLLTDYIGRFENLHEDFQKVCNMVDISNIELDRRNVSKVSNVDYRNYYSIEAKDAVDKLYRDDVESFNYEF